jgi:hypothetical protein
VGVDVDDAYATAADRDLAPRGRSLCADRDSTFRHVETCGGSGDRLEERSAIRHGWLLSLAIPQQRCAADSADDPAAASAMSR